ncbi:5506_t:CDS:2 [Funneliformis caledonium]|uniref:5506_t:CDS:1 n=1 Tax=Funneliformis caledonium TaxID=1117310 RepID=A0A9N9GHS1_9GLOM|nr:5506_t:CDS:2 [Funneliformis caledonium]
MLKKKLQLSRDTPFSVLHSNLFYGVTHLYHRHLQALSDALLTSLNDTGVFDFYQHLNINWYATSFCINDNIASAYTSYEASTVQKKKIQRLLEMLPTMEILKIRYPNIYDPTWLCFRCDCADETYSHIWECPTTWTL